MKNLFQSNIKLIVIGTTLIILSATGVAIASRQANKAKPEISTVESITPSPDPEPSPTPTLTPSPAKKPSAKTNTNVLGTTTSDSNTNAVVTPQPTQPPTQQYVPNTSSSQPINVIIIQPTTPPAPTATPTPIPFVSPEIEAALAQLDQTLTNIENQPVAMNIIEGRRQRAYQDWVNNNQAIYAQIVGSHYKNNLNAILTAHGMWYYTIQ